MISSFNQPPRHGYGKRIGQGTGHHGELLQVFPHGKTIYSSYDIDAGNPMPADALRWQHNGEPVPAGAAMALRREARYYGEHNNLGHSTAANIVNGYYGARKTESTDRRLTASEKTFIQFNLNQSNPQPTEPNE